MVYMRILTNIIIKMKRKIHRENLTNAKAEPSDLKMKYNKNKKGN